jgi:hypothetical protein
VTAEFQAPEVIEITPELAREWLGFNTRNRPMRARTVSAYAWDMLSGNWQWNGESIKFAADGTLLDGQHRLNAITEAGITVRMLVIRGLPGETQDTVDGGVKRKFSDVLALRGERLAVGLAALTRRVAIWEATGMVAGRSAHAPTNSQMLQVLEKYPWLREVAASSALTAAKCDLPASIIGFCTWRFNGLPDAADDVTFFFQRLADFQGLTKGDPIYELRKASESSRSVRGERSEVYLTAITIKAWNAYRDGRQVGLLTFKPGGARPEKFPEPK